MSNYSFRNRKRLITATMNCHKCERCVKCMHMDIGKKFRKFRIKAGLSQKEAAELIGVKNYQLGNYETNRSEPSIAVLKKMSQVYGVSIDALVGNYSTLEEKGFSLKPSTKDPYEPDEVLKTILEYIQEFEEKRNK